MLTVAIVLGALGILSLFYFAFGPHGRLRALSPLIGVVLLLIFFPLVDREKKARAAAASPPPAANVPSEIAAPIDRTNWGLFEVESISSR